VAGRNPRAARRETASAAPGAEEIVTRLADALLAQALRVALAELQSSDGAGVLALRDPRMAAAIERIHRRPDHAWTVGELAGAEIALKVGYGTEFSFAKAFKRTFGIAPGTYRGQQHAVPGRGRDADTAVLAQEARGRCRSSAATVAWCEWRPGT
jgi:methylphosphotriester-DNA--protein-cysteine methyltransferase